MANRLAEGKAVHLLQSRRNLLKWTKEEFQEWNETPNHGEPVGGSLFISLKVPLSTLYEVHFDKKEFLTPSSFIENLFARNESLPAIDVGLIIDATGENYYYHDTKEWDDWDAKFVKLPELPSSSCEVPPDWFVQKFLQSAHSFWSGPEKYRHVAVFTKKGYNHAGFLIVSFLVEYTGLALDIAIKAYQESRPPGIYSEACIKALYSKYHSTLSSPKLRIPCPAPPKWDAHALSLNPNAKPGAGPETIVSSGGIVPAATVESNEAVGQKRLPSPPRFTIDTAKPERKKIRVADEYVEPFPFGEIILPDSEEGQRLKTILANLTGCKDEFPGCETVSLTSKILESERTANDLSLSNYFVSWRARGRRCLLLILSTAVYAVSRDLSFAKLNMHFPRRRSPKERVDKTLLDGVLVKDRDKENIVWRYLAFDILLSEGIDVHKNRFDKRLQILQNDIIMPRKQEKKLDYSSEPFHIRMKDQFKLSRTEDVLRNFIPRITHRVEGLVFTPIQRPYNLGGWETSMPIYKFTGGGMPLDGGVSESVLLEFLRKHSK